MNAKKIILLVDDDPDFTEINQIILESAGYDVEVAHSARAGLEKVRNKKYDAIILDLIMEEKDSGFTFAYNIRNDEKLRHIPILMLTSAEEKTGFTFQPEKDKEWMKVDDFATKPLRPDELITRIANLLKNK